MKQIKEGTVQYAAALHWAVGALGEFEVPVGEHDVSRVQITVTCPEGATVSREAGSEGDGYEAAKGSVGLAVALLAIRRSGMVIPCALWKSCMIEVAQLKLKPKDLAPAEAMEALAELGKEMQPDCMNKKRTSAERGGVAGVEIRVERLSLKSFKAQGPHKRPRKPTSRKTRAIVKAV